MRCFVSPCTVGRVNTSLFSHTVHITSHHKLFHSITRVLARGISSDVQITGCKQSPIFVQSCYWCAAVRNFEEPLALEAGGFDATIFMGDSSSVVQAAVWYWTVAKNRKGQIWNMQECETARGETPRTRPTQKECVGSGRVAVSLCGWRLR